MKRLPQRCLVAASILLAAGPGAAGTARAAEPAVTAKPALFPAFDPSVRDYVSRCHRDAPLRLSLDAPTGTRASVDGGKARAGSSSARVKLRAGEATQFTLAQGEERRRYHVRCLPKNYPNWLAVRSGPTQTQYYLVTPHQGTWSDYVLIYDSHGVPIWWQKTRTSEPFDAKLLPNGRLAWSRYYGEFQIEPRHGYEQHTLYGRRLSNHQAVGSATDMHDFQELPNGHFLLLTYKPRNGVDLSRYGGPKKATGMDAEIQEQTPKGKVVWRWNSKDHISLDEVDRWWHHVLKREHRLADGRGAYDLMHINSVERDGPDHLIISMRYTDAVYRIRRDTGKVDWKLGGVRTAKSLEVFGDPFASFPFGGQHDARVYEDGTYTIFDNQTNRQGPPRAVRYRVDRLTRTATLLESINDRDVGDSGWAGGARKLPGGNWVVSWGGKPIITEARPSGEVVFRLTLKAGKWSYRAFPIPFGTFPPAKLRDAMNKRYPRG